MGWVGNPQAPGALLTGNRRGTHCTGAWVGHRTGLDGGGESRPSPGFDPRAAQSVASR